MEFISRWFVLFLVKTANFTSKTGIGIVPVFAPSKRFHRRTRTYCSWKIFNKNAVGTTPGKILHAGSDVRVEVNIVGSQVNDLTRIGLWLPLLFHLLLTVHTNQVVIPQFGIISRKLIFQDWWSLWTISVWLPRDPKEYLAMTDVIHKVLNDITVDEWAIIMVVTLTQECQRSCFWCWFGNCSTCIGYRWSFNANSESVKVTFKGDGYLYGFPWCGTCLSLKCWSNLEEKMCSKGRYWSAFSTLTADQAFTLQIGQRRWKLKLLFVFQKMKLWLNLDC
jgi:aconitate hydratase 2/2-methylisocitrate dehydratase